MITADSLTKSYGSVPVVRDVSFHCAPGTITGFLGPNGAGKSTSLRMLTGLTPPDRGSSTVAGRPFVELPNPLRTVGVLLDATAMHPGRTGRRTLHIAARIAGLPLDGVDAALHRVGLAGAADRRVGNYSLGMRQRLGIAAALIGDPTVLILDEPANGLDPAGIRWMRDLLRDYADHGGTVLLSSHLLAEIEIIADDIVMIGQGRIVCQGSKADLLQAAGTVVRSADIPALQHALATAGVSTTVADDGSLRTEADPASVGRAAYDGGVVLTELRNADSGGLEEMFLELTADTQRERTAA